MTTATHFVRMFYARLTPTGQNSHVVREGEDRTACGDYPIWMLYKEQSALPADCPSCVNALSASPETPRAAT